ncbi:MAG: AbrB/MazE/SpoVT family DNA-binding domain-containing protein [Candidatus Zophobacter franzmannii]|nr:AbrB/MazE/SpoVT family DNA-binding domain-containing protein [Candidatus Zophobacter franzmannii]
MIEFKDGACICGTVKVGERGQIVIPKKAREYFNINAGDSLIVLGDKNKGLTIIKADKLEDFAQMLLQNAHENKENKDD